MTTDVADGGLGRRPVPDASDAVAGEVAELLARHGGAVVHGPWGAGKSTLLEAVCRRWSGGVRRVRNRPGDELLPCSGLVQLSEEFLPYAGGEVDAATRLRLRVLAARTLREAPRPLVAVDDVQWLDPVSADVLGHAAAAVGRDRLAVVAAERTVGPPHRAAELLGGHPPVVPVPPAGHEEVADRLEALGLPVRWSAAVLRHCGGNRALLAACCEGLARRPPARGGPLGPLPLDGLERADALADAWLRTVPEEVRRTLRTAALAHRPDTDLLYRAGHREAHDHVAHAVRAGLLTTPDGPDGTGPAAVRFSARALARAAAAAGTAADRRRDHEALAAAVSDPVRAVWHRATATEGTDRPAAEDAARAAVAARAAGDRDLASGLLLLAARLTPPHLPGPRSERLAEAALDAAAAGDVGGARRAAACLVREHGAPEQRVKALLAVVDACGQDLTTTETLFAAARGAARDDPRLLAAVELRAAIRANVAAEDFDGALLHARTAAALARRAGDDALHAAALTMAARMERVLGRPDDARATLRSALALAVPPHALGVANSPEYLGARLAVFDGHLARARTSLLALLPVAQAAGGAEDLTDLCRSLAEVDAGLGACADALAWAARARSYTREANLSPGPVWYTSALVHCHGGSFEEAGDYALRALRASRSEGDRLHTTRGLWIAGAVHLHRGRIGQALAAFEELAAGGGSSRPDDPVALRWQADAVEAFAAAGLLERAHGMLDRLDGATAARASHAFARATVSRARALCLAGAGDLDRAAGVFEEAAAAFAALGRPVEQGRTLLAWGRVERRRRRVATAKAVWERARSVCAGAGAHPWSALVDGHLARLAGAASGAAGPDGGEAYRLTERERLLVRLVAEGRSNPEAAHRLFVSRKTVEAMLSRVYRKVGVRNRTELAALVGTGGGV
ncbi:LuxR family transcriptional regulator [Streptomyces sp. WAC08241]|uniref:helix-turn-helix transcriptional regulator n=1 Tax=Streptomyces sp. WAC08241 TaxID=2487421 RepID=UPI000F767FA1|nr:LuxR family transcriptional regulator [Streptomyces sp. WAC08241]RSS34613.1 helix-turn-helix transcriptional regulator [Streptomyces sp. WAC08241]